MTNAAQLAEDLRLATERLAEVIERETECLRRGRPSEMAAIVDEKRRSAADHEAQLAGFRSRSEGEAALDARTHETLLHAANRLRQATLRNARAIETARSITMQLLGAITKSAAAAEHRAQGYGRSLAPVKKRQTAVSISLDQRF